MFRYFYQKGKSAVLVKKRAYVPVHSPSGWVSCFQWCIDVEVYGQHLAVNWDPKLKSKYGMQDATVVISLSRGSRPVANQVAYPADGRVLFTGLRVNTLYQIRAEIIHYGDSDQPQREVLAYAQARTWQFRELSTVKRAE